jgi:hypothetical protein
VLHKEMDVENRVRMRCQPFAILLNFFLAAVVLVQAGCGAAGLDAQAPTPGSEGNATASVQVSTSLTMLPATATATASPDLPTATPTPTLPPSLTPTASPSPTPAWQPYSGILINGEQVTVAPSTIDTSTPIDILPEFTLAGFYLPADCLKNDDASPILHFETAKMLQKGKQMDSPLLLSCGWQKNEQVKLTVRYPDGRKNVKTITAGLGSSGSTVYSISFFYQLTLDDPAGVYTFIAESEQKRTETQLTVEKAYYTLGPRVFAIYDDPFKAYYQYRRSHQGRVLLYGFAPNEQVRLLLYHGKKKYSDNDYYYAYSYIGSQQVVTGPDGNLVIKNQIPGAGYWVAVGETSGMVTESYYDETGNLKAPTRLDVQCPVLLPTRLNDSMYIRVAEIDTPTIRVRKEPGFDKKILGEIPEGTEMLPQGSARCADQTWWWLVYPDMLNGPGWVAETDPQEYILEPVK